MSKPNASQQQTLSQLVWLLVFRSIHDLTFYPKSSRMSSNEQPENIVSPLVLDLIIQIVFSFTFASEVKTRSKIQNGPQNFLELNDAQANAASKG